MPMASLRVCAGAGKTGKAPCVNTPALKRQAAALSSILQELNIPSTASPWSRLEGDTAGYTSLCHPSQSGHALPTPLAMSCDESTGLVRSLELNVRSAAGQLPGSLIGLRDSLTRLTVSCSCSQQGRCPALQVNSEWPATLVNLAQLDFLGLRECPEWAGPLPAALPQQLSELQINNFGFTGGGGGPAQSLHVWLHWMCCGETCATPLSNGHCLGPVQGLHAAWWVSPCMLTATNTNSPAKLRLMCDANCHARPNSALFNQGFKLTLATACSLACICL